MIPNDFIQTLLSRIDIVDVVDRYVPLKKTGANFSACCPFHSEKTPSFTVSPSKQFYHCFGCGVHGTAIGFLMEYGGKTFPDAIEELARDAGLTVPRVERPGESERREEADDLTAITLTAAKFYRAQLKESPRAIDYLKQRGLTGAIAARFGIGYAPDAWQPLAAAFDRYDNTALETAGLVIAGEGGKRYDRFRDRIMFPIRGVQGPVIGFGGRVLDRGEPKYLNSPETPVFVKGRELYGLFEGRTEIRQRGYALVVEGYMDVVALAQSGFGNAVATLGTACTAEHVQKLVRFTDAVVFSFDGDAAGRRAAGRALEASLPHATDTRSFRFLFLPPEHDPDSYVRELGAAAFDQCVAGAVPLSRQIVAQAGDGLDFATAEGRARFLANVQPLWTGLPDGMLKRQLLGEIAARAALAADELAALWRVGVAARARPAPSAGTRPMASRAASRRPIRQAIRQPHDRVAWMLLLESAWWDELGAADHALLCALPGWHGEAFRFLDRETAEHGRQPWAALRERVAAEPWGDAALALVDGEDPAIEPLLDDLRSSMAQLRGADLKRAAAHVLGRTG